MSMFEGGFFFQVSPPEEVLEDRPEGVSLQSATLVWTTAYADAENGGGYRLLDREDLRPIYEEGYEAGEEMRKVRASLEEGHGEEDQHGHVICGDDGEDSVFDACDPDHSLFYSHATHSLPAGYETVGMRPGAGVTTKFREAAPAFRDAALGLAALMASLSALVRLFTDLSRRSIR